MNRAILNYRYVLDAVFGRLNDLQNIREDVIKDSIYAYFSPRPVTADEIIARYLRLPTIIIDDPRLSERERKCVAHFLAGKGYDSSDSTVVRLAIKVVRDHIARTGCDDPLAYFLICDFRLKARYEDRRFKPESRYDYFILGTGDYRYKNTRYYREIYDAIPATYDNFMVFLYGYSTTTYTQYQRMKSILVQKLVREEYAYIIRYL